ncbi:MAG: hypothetical protein M3468_10205, partial [Acidobacteriota bacterium]|nr:hypothetical protein [Acidobacteriota bacterium]
MRTTLLNPTVWLLVATCVAGVVGAVRGRTASASVDSLLRVVCARPILVLLIGLALFGLGSRAVLGFLSPGAYAEEVIAARTFVEQRDLYGSGVAPSQALGDPSVANLPWLSSCQGNAITNRAKFYTDHAHPPMLLLAGVPVVYLGGAKLLYLSMLAASLGAIAVMSAVLLARAGLGWRSPAGLVVIAAVAGWQPVLAGIRQGDAVLPAAGLVALTWYLLGRRSGSERAALPSAIAACLAIPSVGVLPALWRTAPRVAVVATGILLAIVGATIALAGAAVVPAFLQTVAETARTYAGAPANYAIVGRALEAGAVMPVLALGFLLVLVCSWWRGTNADAAFATFGVAGLMLAPVLWSQHLALLLVPFTVLFARTLRHGSSLGLASVAALALVFSLPDTIAIRLAQVSSSLTLIALSSALVLVWAWTAFGDDTDLQSTIVNPSIANPQSPIVNPSIVNPSIANPQSAIVNGRLSAVTRFVTAVVVELRWRLAGAVLVALALAAVEGTGLLLLIPLLSSIGLAVDDGLSNRIAGLAGTGFAAVGLEPTLLTVLGIFLVVSTC